MNGISLMKHDFLNFLYFWNYINKGFYDAYSLDVSMSLVMKRPFERYKTATNREAGLGGRRRLLQGKKKNASVFGSRLTKEEQGKLFHSF